MVRLFLALIVSLFVVGCAPATKENVVTPKKNPNADKVNADKGMGENPRSEMDRNARER